MIAITKTKTDWVNANRTDSRKIYRFYGNKVIVNGILIFDAVLEGPATNKTLSLHGYSFFVFD
jgi:hypothetical protein